MQFLKLRCVGCFNSFRQPDFHTYHKTLPLPPKTTVAGMIGSALGISPREVNDDWLKKERFRMAVVGKHNGRASDLWQIRKYAKEQIDNYNKGKEATPYKTAVIVRELLYASEVILYLSFNLASDYDLVLEALQNPAWALSLGREDELVRIISLERIDLEVKTELQYSNTVLPFDINVDGYSLDTNALHTGRNLLSEAPRTVMLPITFTHKKDSEIREADSFQAFTFVSDLPVKPIAGIGFYDEAESCAFQVV